MRKLSITLFVIISMAFGFSLNFSAIDSAYATGTCENDVCLETEAGFVCADHTQLPGREDGQNCDVGPDGEDCSDPACE